MQGRADRKRRIRRRNCCGTTAGGLVPPPGRRSPKLRFRVAIGRIHPACHTAPVSAERNLERHVHARRRSTVARPETFLAAHSYRLQVVIRRRVCDENVVDLLRCDRCTPTRRAERSSRSDRIQFASRLERYAERLRVELLRVRFRAALSLRTWMRISFAEASTRSMLSMGASVTSSGRAADRRTPFRMSPP